MRMSKAMVLVSAILLGACSSTPQTSSNTTMYSGFLGDYSNMKTVMDSENNEVLRWVKPDLVKGKYAKLIIKPVTYYPYPKTNEQVTQTNLDKIASYLTERVKLELGKNFELTDKPGSDTAEVSVAITGVETSLEGLKIYEVTPVTLVYAGATAALGKRDKVVAVYVEGITKDSLSGEPLVKAVRKGTGEKLPDDKQQLQVENLKTVLDSWAKGTGTLAAQLK